MWGVFDRVRSGQTRSGEIKLDRENSEILMIKSSKFSGHNEIEDIENLENLGSG